MLWGTVNCDVPFEVTCKFVNEDKEYAFEALIKKAKELNIRDLM